MRHASVALVLLVVASGVIYGASGAPTSGARGIDIAYALLTQSEWNCLRSTNNHTVAIIESWRGVNGYNTNAKPNTDMALAAGFTTIDYYFYPTVKNDAATQVETCISKMTSEGLLASKPMIYIDIEQPSGWYSSCSSNVAVVTTLVETFASLYDSTRIGFYSEVDNWKTILCNTCNWSSYALWWADWDEVKDCSAYSSSGNKFGCFSWPLLKQYIGDYSECGIGVDGNIYC
ncbi:glycoside hydrolase family 25 protein [Pelomyxa schiedti]|nr:glycoside hydrolase family 25 protein [Pelomyxa schiedti]